MKKHIQVKQHDITDCGAACLASVAAHYHYHLPLSRIRQYASTDTKGTNVLGMIEAATRLGFTAKGVRGTLESLFKIPLPAIVHVVVKQELHHFMVLYQVKAKYVLVMDPGDGIMHRLSHEAFKNQWTGVLILLLPDTQFKTGNEKTSVLTRFWQLAQPHQAVLLQAFVGAVLYTVLGLSTSIYVQKTVDYVLVGGNKNLLNLMSVVMILLLLLQLLIGTIKSIFALKTGQQMDAQLILGYYKHLLTLPQTFFDSMRVGEIISRINDAVKIRTFINDAALNLVVNVFIVLFSFGLMFTYYWKLALMMLIIIPFYGLIYFITNKLNKKVQRKLMEDSAELQTQLVESLNTMATIKRFGLESYANLKTETSFIKLLKTIFQATQNAVYLGTGAEFITRLFTILILWAGAYSVLNHTLTAGELLSFYALIGYFTGPVNSLIGMNKTLQDALIAADRLFEIMDLEREEIENKIDLKREMIADIHFREVAFRYGSRATVFENLNLTIAQGKVTAIVGESGSGKTTLMALLQNIYPLTSGHITIGNYDLKHISTTSLRSLVSVVPQNIDLFAGNVIENIAVGVFKPDMEKVLRICEALGIAAFVEKLPNGFNTYLGENGATLSGGQKQRIAIARALYQEPEILILDEATSSLDSHSEQYVQSSIQQLRKAQKTVILIAHRLSTVMQADQIIVLEEGKLVEAGTHEELLLTGKYYYKLWAQQFRFAKPDFDLVSSNGH
ncbi:bacteriocin cleavage/export ABC transporter [Adhaeribacter aerolatus]|uniref:Bacteriocin cleavage/export ABC transporter n=1 Tax=Adhaeribacter aerolatus TaxID=670289 RepID=A0A512B5C9_9BACT|nr:peptidase domain-containing ABC transporter [Adhaeribacter aerolatus]GEO07141.1 bacteriocin cleavage/export ABC transporter [Adhaeribacter aerolatus]